METIASRIIELGNDCVGGNMSAFAREIGVTPAYISKLKNEPDRTPSDRTIKEICRVFKVDEVWLRTGIGSPNIKKSRKEELNATFSDALDGVSDKDKFLRAVASVPDSAFPALVEFIRTLAAELGE